MTEFGDAHAGGIESGQDDAMLEVSRGQNHRLDFVSRQDDGKGVWLFGIGNILDHPRPPQGRLAEKAQSAHGLDEKTLGGLLLEEMELIGPDMLGAELIW